MTETYSLSILAGRTLFSYEEYRNNIAQLIKGQPSGLPPQPEDKASFLPLNLQRMRRVEKTMTLQPDLKGLLLDIKKPLLWLVFAEPWCGDGAQSLPSLNLMAETNMLIELKIILRDRNHDLMDKYLTDGKRSIPKLICLNSETDEELFTWGARPSSLEKQIIRFKEEHSGYTHGAFLSFIHYWYALDKGNGIQKDFQNLLSRI
jgi:hypothetical protein